MKEFNICLGRRLTVGDICVSTLTYKDWLKIIGGFVVGCDLKGYMATKDTSVSNSFELISALERFSAAAYESISPGLAIDGALDLAINYKLSPLEVPVVLSDEVLHLISVLPANAASELVIDNSKLQVFTGTALGRGASAMILSSSNVVGADALPITGMLTLSPALNISANLAFEDTGYVQAESGVVVASNVVSLSYSLGTTIKGGMFVGANVAGMVPGYPLGEIDSAIYLESKFNGTPTLITPLSHISSSILLDSYVTSSLTVVAPAFDGAMLVDSSLNVSAKRYRELGEVDELGTLDSIDAATLASLDLIELY